MNSTFIYALCEPGTRTVRYIGKSDRPKRRFREHLRSSIKFQSHLGCWLRSLLSAGKEPDLIVLGEVPRERWEEAEERYIRLARGCRMNLVNATDGGESGPYPTEETKAKIRKARENQVISEVTREKLRVRWLGPKNPNFGKPPSPSTREKIAVKLRGRKVTFSESHCSALSEATKKAWERRLATPEARAADSASRKASWDRKKATQV